MVWVFFLKANPLVSLLFSRNIDDRFINLVRVSKKKTATATYLSLSGCRVRCFLERMRRVQKGDVNGIRRNLIQTH